MYNVNVYLCIQLTWKFNDKNNKRIIRTSSKHSRIVSVWPPTSKHAPASTFSQVMPVNQTKVLKKMFKIRIGLLVSLVFDAHPKLKCAHRCTQGSHLVARLLLSSSRPGSLFCCVAATGEFLSFASPDVNRHVQLEQTVVKFRLFS